MTNLQGKGKMVDEGHVTFDQDTTILPWLAKGVFSQAIGWRL